MRKSMGMLIVVAMLVLAAGTTFAQTGEQCTVTGSNVNLRAGPGTQYDVAGTISRTLPVTGQNIDGTWYRVKYEVEPAWVAATVAITEGDCDGLPYMIELEPFTCEAASFAAVRPAGWLDTGPTQGQVAGCGFVSGAVGPGAGLSFLAAEGSGSPEISTLIAEMSAISQPRTYTTARLEWTIYEMQIMQDANLIASALAVTEAVTATGTPTSYAVMFVAMGVSQPDALQAAVLEPVLDQFVPLSDESPAAAAQEVEVTAEEETEVAAEPAEETAAAATDCAMLVSGNNVNLRAGPGTHFDVVGALNGSLPVTGQNSNATWYQVAFHGEPAWVAAHVVVTSGDCGALPVGAASGPCMASGQNINLRAGPDASFAVVAVLSEASPIVAKNGDASWYQVNHKGQTAWAAAHVISISGDCSSLSTSTNTGNISFTLRPQAHVFGFFPPQGSTLRPASTLAGVTLPAPQGIERYATSLAFGPERTSFAMVLDLLSADRAVFTIDTNHNGDLTDDTPYTVSPLNPTPTIALSIPYGDQELPGHYQFYYYEQGQGVTLLRYRAGMRVGNARVGNASFNFAVLDDDADGIFNGQLDALIVDTNWNSYYEMDEEVMLSSPLKINSICLSIEDLNAAGTAMQLATAEPGTISGTVRDLQGRAIPGATVTLFDITATVNAEGFYEIPVCPGDYTRLQIQAAHASHMLQETRLGVVRSHETYTYDFVLQPIGTPPSGTVTLELGDSYDFLTGASARYAGGEFYLGTENGRLQFFCNNTPQRGIASFGAYTGDLNAVTLNQISQSRFTMFGVPVVEGHTYVALARQGEEGNYVVLRVVALADNQVTLEFVYKLAD